eukprot:513284-Pyramimonas_sp.AAC.1
MATGVKDDSLEYKPWHPIMESFDKLAGPIDDQEWGAILVFWGSDLEYACNELGMVRHLSHNCCCECDANSSTVPHNDFSAGAAWRGTLGHNETYMTCFRRPLHPVVAH